MEAHRDLLYAVSTIEDGNMSCNYGDETSVIDNRKRFLGKLGLDLNDCVMMHLNHGNRVAVVGETDKGSTMSSCGADGVQADSFITKEKGVYLFLLTADCLPLTLYDPNKRLLGLVHLSRMTTGARLAEKTLKAMQDEWGSNLEDIQAWGGPSISKECYGLDFFNEGVSEWGDFITKMPDGKIHVDVTGFNRAQLLAMGVKENNIDISDVDTFSSPIHFSHYRASRTGETEGRFTTVVGIKDL
ncbi:MAG: polyphenol oxidase family protein [Candidatus Colwellbacteria bacterium]